MQLTLAIHVLTTTSWALADNWAAFGARPTGHVSAAAGDLLGLGRRQTLETAVEPNSTIKECDVSVMCEDSIGEGCCSENSECCGGLGCCDAGFKCGLPALSLCCRVDQDVCGGNGCYSENDGESCCGNFEVCKVGEECCGIICCKGGQKCHEGLCQDVEDIEVNTDEDECCAAGGCCPAGSSCHRGACKPGESGRAGALGVEAAGLVGGLVLWLL
ncbi:uncharacterized protein DNG_03947 [Cephalotrichum gorgonifer]|uniref:Stig1 domain-containing protein n=1 Tax=Cephalotrichum gorgonifer TaxID=2041049 RepID=A0AAE8SU20_9PEZI|nr:uncharacterized protein DNG_03947 [Cephalotrichum gorgonifer]